MSQEQWFQRGRVYQYLATKRGPASVARIAAKLDLSLAEVDVALAALKKQHLVSVKELSAGAYQVPSNLWRAS